MLTWGQQIEQDIVLWANTHELSHLIRLLEHVDVIDSGSSASLVDKTSQHRDGGSLSSAIVSEQSEDLALIHPHIEIVDGLEVSKLFRESFHLHHISSGFQSAAHHWWSLKVLSANGGDFKLIILIACQEHLLVVSLLGGSSALSPVPAAAVEARHAAEDWVAGLAVLARQHSVEPHTDEHEQDETHEEHQHGDPEAVVVVEHFSC